MPNNKINLFKIRKELHQNAELSNYEIITSSLVKKYIEPFNPDKVISFDYGLAFVWDSHLPGKTIMFRADMDALPISEKTGKMYTSRNSNVMHACGHDGHMSILIGLAEKIYEKKPKSGRVVLLFQPAEETGEGAFKVTEDQKFKEIEPDLIFGLHNIPGYSQKEVIIKKGSFACASRGMIVKLFGKTSHAGEPENGINPVFAIKKLIDRLYTVIQNKDNFSNFTSLTIIFIKLGEVSFGTSPGYAEVMLTLRSETNNDMAKLIQLCENIVTTTSKEENLKKEISYTEIFPATVNNAEAVNIIMKEVNKLNYNYTILETPFKWSEDFSYYTNKYKGAFFGFGSGMNQPSLHNPDYDFPDEILKKGVKLFLAFIKHCSAKR